MIIGNVKGGLGNQMFQYAFSYAVSRKDKTLLKLDISDFDSYGLRQYQLDKYCIEVAGATVSEVNRLKYKKEGLFVKFFRALARKEKHYANSYYREDSFQLDSDAANEKGDVYFDGYWQSEKYFCSYRADLLKHFSLKVPVHAKSKEYQQQILANQSVSLHIRRGDYVTNTKANEFHGTCDLDYYRQAVSFIKEAENNPFFFIFSDDLEWAKENIDFIDQVVFVELGEDSLDHEEMWLMSECQHNIIANSSFSWWGAWLNTNPSKIVVTPKRWFNDSSINTKDLIPESWIRL